MDQKTIEAAIRALAEDEEFVGAQWRRGARIFLAHAWETFSVWAMRRIFTYVTGAAVVAGLIWAVKSGMLK